MKKRFKNEEENFFVIAEEDDSISSGITAPHTLTAEEVLGTKDSKEILSESHNALEALKKRMSASHMKLEKESDISNSFSFIEPEPQPTEDSLKEPPKEEKSILKDEKSLLDKCMPYLIEEDGSEANLNKEPLYKLQSVADILRSDSEKILEKLSEKYDVLFEDLSIDTSISAVENPVSSYETEQKNEEKLHEKEDIIPKIEDLNEKNEKPSSFEDIMVISDIDTPANFVEKPKNDLIHNTSTITFTPISKGENGAKINISTQTRPLDLTGELAEMPESIDSGEFDDIKLEKDEFEDYTPENEIDFEKDSSRFIRKYSLLKRNSFISSFLSFFATALLCLYYIPPINDLINSEFTVSMIISSAIALIAIISNADCFKGLAKIFTPDSTPDISAALSVITITLYSVFGIITRVTVTEAHILLCAILSFRSLGKFFGAARMLSNLKTAASPSPKNTLKLIDDTAISLTMAEGSVDGDALVADTQQTGNISDFMKYSTYGKFIDGRLPLITALSLILSVIIGFACGFYFDGIAYGFYAAAVIQCLTALPTAFLIDNLPLYKATKKLSRSGAMILGKAGAAFSEMANAAVISADKLFPPGSVTLHQMQALSANNLEDTIIRAASLTECLGSTLAPIFKTIAGTGNITALPDSDTVKYEDRMGISGWVDNRLLFIGNRTLLETHSIPVPSLELDRKILRQGYFPVYVATQNRACALIMIQYNVDKEIAKELRKLTNSGVDLLINSCDPNLTEEMICDYFGLYSDSVKVMTTAGRHLHRNTTAAVKTASVPAVCGSDPVGIASVLNCSAGIKATNLLLTISYILAAVLGILIFAYSSFAGSGTLLSCGTVLIYSAISTVISYLLYFTKKP